MTHLDRDEPVTALLRGYVDRHEIAGAAIRIRRAGDILAEATLGLADLAQQRPIIPISIFRLASLTKPIVAVAVMQLVEQGKIGLDDPVGRHIPAFTNTTVAEYGSTAGALLTADPEDSEELSRIRGLFA